MVDFFVIAITSFVPLIITPTPLDCYYLPKVLTIYVLCIFMLIYYFKKLRKKLFNNYTPDYLLAGYLLLVALSTVFSVDRVQAVIGGSRRWEGFLTISCYIFIYFITSKHYTFSNKHLKYVFISGIMISACAVAQYYGYTVIKIDPIRVNWAHWRITSSTIGSRNFLGSYSVLLLPLSMFYYINFKKTPYLIASCLLYANLLCTTTRGSWIGFIILLLPFIYFICMYKINVRYLLITLSLFTLVTYAINTTTDNSLLLRTLTLKSDAMNITADKAGTNRMFIWKNSLKLIPERPILGSGPDTLGIVFNNRFGDEAREVFKDEGIVDKAHNEYLQQAVTTGIPSMLLYISFGLTILIRAYKNIKNNKMLIPLFCSILGYAVQAFFNISVVSVAPVMWALLGITANLAYAEKTQVHVTSREFAY